MKICKIGKFKKILNKYPSDLIIKAQIDDEVIEKLEYSEMTTGWASLQIMGNDYPYECKAITVSNLLNILEEFKNNDNVLLIKDITEDYDINVVVEGYMIKGIIQKDDSLILVGAYIGTKIY